jgi:hypothetical protein
MGICLGLHQKTVWLASCLHDIIHIHNNVMWDWQYSTNYSWIFFTFNLNYVMCKLAQLGTWFWGQPHKLTGGKKGFHKVQAWTRPPAWQQLGHGRANHVRLAGMADTKTFTSWTMKLSHVRGHFPIVIIDDRTFMVQFLKNTFSKPLGPWLGVNQRGPRKMTMHQKVDVLIFFFHL